MSAAGKFISERPSDAAAAIIEGWPSAERWKQRRFARLTGNKGKIVPVRGGRDLSGHSFNPELVATRPRFRVFSPNLFSTTEISITSTSIPPRAEYFNYLLPVFSLALLSAFIESFCATFEEDDW